ncbi:MAG: OmpA family protein [Bacteroidota bacterium]
MKNYIKQTFKFTFISLSALILITSCASHKNCGEAGAKSKYSSKRYSKALHERDSLCGLTKVQSDKITALNKSYSDLTTEYDNLRQNSGSALNKLSADLGSNQAKLQQREARLRELESILRRQDSILNMLNNSVKNALLGFSPDELTVEMKNGKVYVSMSDKLLFKSGDANVEAKGKEALKKLAEVLNKNNDVSIAIEGHTDNVPIKTAIYKDNWDLSAARATNVVRLLTAEYGMGAQRLTASGKGEYFPVADNSTTEGKAKNRRTEVVLSPKLDELMKLIVNK